MIMINKNRTRGKLLLEEGFRTWFLFFFKYIEHQDFIIEPIHEELFKVFQDIYECKTNRQIINICPRSGKTTLSTYFIAYCLTLNPYCNFIYTSYSIQLTIDAYERIKKILTSELYKDMYSNNCLYDDVKEEVFDEYWFNEKKQELGNQFYFSNKKITTGYNGTIYFNSIGSQITGFGFGSRINNNKFNGCLFIDDPQKAQSIRYKRQKEKIQEYYNDVLLTRANSSTSPIVLIQQRLAIDDLTGYIQEKYNNYNILKLSLVKDNICQLPKQYTEERIKELQINNYLWKSQYQQEPVIDGGSVIKTEWFKNYDILPKLKRYYIVCDTAMKTKENSDYSVFLLVGKDNLSQDANYYFIDMIRGHWDSVELLDNLRNFYEKHKTKYNISCLYIEDKASGVGLIQQIKRLSIPVHPITPTKDKYTRLMDVLPRIASGYVFLPNVSNWKIDFINECQDFRADMSHTHDDIVDCLSYSLSQEVNKNNTIDWLY